jgi:hypothetical protein
MRDMDNLEKEIQAYDKMRDSLEASHTGKWVLIHDQVLIAIYDTFESAAEDAVKRFGAGPYLIRQVGAPPIVLPASLMYNIVRA